MIYPTLTLLSGFTVAGLLQLIQGNGWQRSKTLVAIISIFLLPTIAFLSLMPAGRITDIQEVVVPYCTVFLVAVSFTAPPQWLILLDENLLAQLSTVVWCLLVIQYPELLTAKLLLLLILPTLFVVIELFSNIPHSVFTKLAYMFVFLACCIFLAYNQFQDSSAFAPLFHGAPYLLEHWTDALPLFLAGMLGFRLLSLTTLAIALALGGYILLRDAVVSGAIRPDDLPWLKTQSSPTKSLAYVAAIVAIFVINALYPVLAPLDMATAVLVLIFEGHAFAKLRTFASDETS